MADLSIKEVKEKKAELERTVFDLVSSFEKETGVRVSYLSLDRNRGYDDWREEDLPLTGVSVTSNFGV